MSTSFGLTLQDHSFELDKNCSHRLFYDYRILDVSSVNERVCICVLVCCESLNKVYSLGLCPEQPVAMGMMSYQWHIMGVPTFDNVNKFSDMLIHSKESRTERKLNSLCLSMGKIVTEDHKGWVRRFFPGVMIPFCAKARQMTLWNFGPTKSKNYLSCGGGGLCHICSWFVAFFFLFLFWCCLQSMLPE